MNFRTQIRSVFTLHHLAMCLLAVASLGLVACSKLTPANLEKVHQGMSQQEVRTILGKPAEESSTTIGPLQSSKWSYHRGEDRVELIFLNDKLLSKTGTFGK